MLSLIELVWAENNAIVPKVAEKDSRNHWVSS